MIREELEYSISQYLDGTLPPLETAALEQKLATDAEARAILAEYRELNDTLAANLPLPAVNFNRLAEHLSETIAKEPTPQRRLVLSTFIRRPAVLALAASVLLALGISLVLYKNHQPTPPTSTAQIIEVTGPAAQIAAAAPVMDITISAAPGVAENNWRASEDVIYRPSRVTWLASSVENSQDNTTDAPY